MNYYNENDPKGAVWLRSLIKAGLIPDGTVDERSICDVQGHELKGYKQVHLFAGIAGWSRALQLASWPTDVPVWTGSCPCQPFSQAGKGKGEKDERHLWPEMRRLIDECRPPICFGEQVASKAGREWLSGVRFEMETLGYSLGASDLCAAGIGAPHIRQRLWWVAFSECDKERWVLSRSSKSTGQVEQRSSNQPRVSGGTRGMGESDGTGRKSGRASSEATRHGSSTKPAGGNGRLGNPSFESREWKPRSVSGTEAEGERERVVNGCQLDGLEHASAGLGFWSGFELIPCRDGKFRRIEPGSFPLAHGIPGRVAQLRGLGNAIVPQVAAEFIGAFLDVARGNT